jgi:hypothetical protein
VHLKDVHASGGEVNVLLGTGIARISEVIQELKVNYRGLVAIEYEHDGPVEDDPRQEVGPQNSFEQATAGLSSHINCFRLV